MTVLTFVNSLMPNDPGPKSLKDGRYAFGDYIPPHGSIIVSDEIGRMLAGGDMRSIGRSNEVAGMVRAEPYLFRFLMGLMKCADPVVRARSADAAEKASALMPGLLRPHRSELLRLMSGATQQEVRWHLAQMAPRAGFSGTQRGKVIEALCGWMGSDKSNIVKAFSMQALADFAIEDPGLLSSARAKIEEMMVAGSPAVKARGRKLLRNLG